MLDLSAFATPCLPAGAARRGIRWWLVHEDIEPDEVLAHLLVAFQAGGWRRTNQDKLAFVLEGPRGRLLVRIEDDPCREVASRTAAGEERRGPLWPEPYDGRVIIAVEVV